VLPLSSAQHRIVTQPVPGPNILVLAGPGSGKTLTITERIAHLLAEHGVEPEQVLVMTFSNRAARELKDRLGRRLGAVVHGLWADTFHAVAARLLRTYGAGTVVPAHFVICDAQRQEQVLRVAAAQCGWIERRRGAVEELRMWISQLKRAGLRPETARVEMPIPQADELYAAYQALLQQTNALDFDDLIAYAIRLLTGDTDVAQSVRRRFSYVFVDEFHDVARDQYTLIRLVSVPGSEQRIVAVADPGQAIYGWADADAHATLRRFRREYHPITYELGENFRSAANLVQAAHVLRDRHAGLDDVISIHDAAAHPLAYVACATREVEAAWIARQITKAHMRGIFSYGQVAVLYRNHWQGELIEAALVARGIAVRRYHKARLFDQPDVQMALRYLDLIAALHDDQFEPALNWPRVLVDELTMIHLRQLARTHGLRVSELAQQIEQFADQISPLTRVAITDFLATIAAELLPVANESVVVIVERLLRALAQRRSPFPALERDTLYGVLDVLAGPLRTPVEHLSAAIQVGREVVIRHADDLDSITGAAILEHVLTHYLRHPVHIEPITITTPPTGFLITFGHPIAADADGFGLAVRDARTIHYSISTQAWRIGQLLLLGYERLRDGRFMIYDLETTSDQVLTAEIVEVAAQPFLRGAAQEEPFNRLVRPKGRIAPDASQIHGIRWRDVQHAPDITAVLPELFAYLGDAPLVGHNITQFDHHILHRLAADLKLPFPSNEVLDTCALARRLLPHESASLTALAQRFGYPQEQTHRAVDDVQLTAFVLERLLDLHQREHELDVLSEVLPLVALGIHASDVPLLDENVLLAAAGTRVGGTGRGSALVDRCRTLAPQAMLVDQAWPSVMACRCPLVEEDREWTVMAQRWQAMVANFQQYCDDHSLPSFLHYARLATVVDDQFDSTERVTLMTMHAAKGLEWPCVFLVGVEEGILPSYRSETEATQAEDRRVLYVGMTRAQQHLCISWSTSACGRSARPSPLLAAVPEALVRHYRIQHVD
jgi:superfamily I DNA/RNA helicase/DNA polymerase III epsilon subunit-like protein